MQKSLKLYDDTWLPLGNITSIECSLTEQCMPKICSTLIAYYCYFPSYWKNLNTMYYVLNAYVIYIKGTGLATQLTKIMRLLKYSHI